jgi:hypothetical protein
MDSGTADAIIVAASQQMRDWPPSVRKIWSQGIADCLSASAAENPPARGRPRSTKTCFEPHRHLILTCVRASSHLWVGVPIQGVLDGHLSAIWQLMLYRLAFIETPEPCIANYLLESGDGQTTSHISYTFLVDSQSTADCLYEELLMQLMAIGPASESIVVREERALDQITTLEANDRLRVYVIPSTYAALPMVMLDIEGYSPSGFVIFPEGAQSSMCEVPPAFIETWKRRLYLRFLREAELADAKASGASFQTDLPVARTAFWKSGVARDRGLDRKKCEHQSLSR